MTRSVNQETARSGQMEVSASRLPRHLTSFVGRKKEREEIKASLSSKEVRLLTLVGAGGVGKTRLAVRVADDIATNYSDGVEFVSLESVSDAHRVPVRIARSLGIREDRGQTFELLCKHFENRVLLLIVDNVEQVIESAPIFSALLKSCDGLSILATSRVPLRISGEHVYQLLPLSLPAAGTDSSLEVVDRSEAVRLFVARALTLNSDLSLEGNAIAAIVEICRKLDGFPLAIELAAARSRQFELSEILELLRNRIAFLDHGARDQPLRMQSLRETIAWSYALLSPEEQRLFRALSAFPAGFTIESAEAINTACDTDRATLELLSSLVDNSLIWKQPSSSGLTRYRMYESIREYGLQALTETKEIEAVQFAIADYFSRLARATEIGLASSADLTFHIDTFEEEEQNFRTAMLTIKKADRAGQFCQLVADLTWFWYYRGRIREGQRWLREADEMVSDAISPEVRGWLGIAAGLFAQVENQNEEADIRLRETAELAETVGDFRMQTMALEFHAAILHKMGETERAEKAFHDLRPKIEQFLNSNWYGHNAFHLGLIAFDSGQMSKAITLFVESVESYERGGESVDATDPLNYLVLAEIEIGDFEAAREGLSKILDRLSMRKSESDTALLFAGLASYLVATNQPKMALRFGSSAISIRNRIGIPLPMPASSYYLAAIDNARTALSFEQIAEETVAGEITSVDELHDLARSILSPDTVEQTVDDRRSAMQSSLGVTDREMDVLRLLAKGLSNAEIGDVLFISPATVRTHVSNLLGKLDAHTRTQAVAIARDKGLLE